MNIRVSMMAVGDNENNGNSPFLLIGAVDHNNKNISILTLFQLAKICKLVLSIQNRFILFSRKGVK